LAGREEAIPADVTHSSLYETCADVIAVLHLDERVRRGILLRQRGYPIG
jgi:hypothetical protein